MSTSVKATKKSAFSCEPCRRRKVRASPRGVEVITRPVSGPGPLILSGQPVDVCPEISRSNAAGNSPCATDVHPVKMTAFTSCKCLPRPSFLCSIKKRAASSSYWASNGQRRGSGGTIIILMMGSIATRRCPTHSVWSTASKSLRTRSRHIPSRPFPQYPPLRTPAPRHLALTMLPRKSVSWSRIIPP